MGLAERRATKEFQEKSLPGLRAEIDKLAGKVIEFDINWEQLAKEDHGANYEEFWRKVYFQPVTTALKSIARDDLGKEAIQAGFRKITCCDTRGAYSPESAISFSGGELTIDHSPTSNVDDVEARAKHIIEIVEKAL